MTLRLNGSTSGYTEIDAPAVAGSNTLLLPTGAGSANQFLKNGSTAGSLGWSSLVEDSSGRLLVGTSSVSDAQVGIASGTGWVYKSYSFGAGNSRTVTVTATANYWVEITLTLTSNNEIAQARTILGRRDVSSHRSATTNIINTQISQTITSSDAGSTRTWRLFIITAGTDLINTICLKLKA